MAFRFLKNHKVFENKEVASKAVSVLEPWVTMEDCFGSSALEITPISYNRRREGLVSAPKDYFLGPVFAAVPQDGPRKVVVVDRCYQIGGFHPMDPDAKPPALNVQHARLTFSLLSFRDTEQPDANRLIRFSFNELCHRYARSNGGRYSRAIKRLMRDLMESYIRVTDLKTGKAHEYRLIERIDIEKLPIRRRDAKLALSGQQEMWFNGCTLSPEFAGLLSRVHELQDLKLDVFNSIRSPLAQAIYLYIPSRAHHHSESDPFQINLTNLLNQVSFPVPRDTWIRKKLFTQNKKSIMRQLDGLETLRGRFRVRLAKTADGSDWKLQAWVEKEQYSPNRVRRESKVLAAYLKSGRTRDMFDRALDQKAPLDDYELELLNTANVVVAKNRPFFELMKALLPGLEFVTLLSEAKGDELEGRKARKNQTARLIHRLMEAVQRPISKVWTAK